MSAARGNHRETVGLRRDADIEEEWSVVRKALRERLIEQAWIANAIRSPTETPRDRHKIRQRGGIAMAVARLMIELLPLPHHAHVTVVADDDLHGRAMLHGRRELLNIH